MKIWERLKSQFTKSQLASPENSAENLAENSREKTRAIAGRFAVAVLAIAVVASLATVSFTKSAKAATPAPAASALDDNSVGALLSLDHAMETLAARVTPAVVNVTVVSKPNRRQASRTACPDMQQFFGPDSPFGQQFGSHVRTPIRFPQQPQNRIEHGLAAA